MAEPSRRQPSRIVVLGGGFAGIYTAMALEKAMDGRGDFEVVLINKENYFVFQPMLPEVISGTIGMLDVVSPIRRLLPRTDLHVREVESVDLQKKVVMCSPGFRAQPHVVPFENTCPDRNSIAPSGSRPSQSLKPCMRLTASHPAPR